VVGESDRKWLPFSFNGPRSSYPIGAVWPDILHSCGQEPCVITRQKPLLCSTPLYTRPASPEVAALYYFFLSIRRGSPFCIRAYLCVRGADWCSLTTMIKKRLVNGPAALCLCKLAWISFYLLNYYTPIRSLSMILNLSKYYFLIWSSICKGANWLVC
jgi:hypothetical protein